MSPHHDRSPGRRHSLAITACLLLALVGLSGLIATGTALAAQQYHAPETVARYAPAPGIEQPSPYLVGFIINSPYVNVSYSQVRRISPYGIARFFTPWQSVYTSPGGKISLGFVIVPTFPICGLGSAFSAPR